MSRFVDISRTSAALLLAAATLLAGCREDAGALGPLSSRGPRSARAVFPFELGDSPEQALSQGGCSEWSREQPDRLRCASYVLDALEDLPGELVLQYVGARLVQARWERRMSWEFPVLSAAARHLDRVLRSNLGDPFFANYAQDPIRDDDIGRGEFHARWYMGKGWFYFWVGLHEASESRLVEHSLVLQLKAFLR